MPEQGNRGHGCDSQTQVTHDVLSMLRESFNQMNAWGIEEQVHQVPTCALTPTPTPTPMHTTAITPPIVTPIPTVTNSSNCNSSSIK